MADLVQLVSSVAVALTICMFLAGMPSCIQIVKQKHVGNVPFLPFILIAVNSLLWLAYGVLTSNWTLIICNSIGYILQTVYVIIYITYATPKIKSFQQTLTALVFLLATYVYLTRFVDTDEMLIRQLGFLGSSLTLLMYTTPIAEVVEIIQTGDASCISVAVTVAQMASASAWASVGLIINDIFIMVPNIPGVIGGIARFFCLYRYGSTRRSIKVELKKSKTVLPSDL